MPITKAKKVMERIKVLHPLMEKSDAQLLKAQEKLLESTTFPARSNAQITLQQEAEQNLRSYLERRGVEHHRAKMVAFQASTYVILGEKFEKALKDALKNRELK